MEYNLTVNDAYINLVHKAVTHYLANWPGGDPTEQVAYMELKNYLDKLKLEITFDLN